MNKKGINELIDPGGNEVIKSIEDTIPEKQGSRKRIRDIMAIWINSYSNSYSNSYGGK